MKSLKSRQNSSSAKPKKTTSKPQAPKPPKPTPEAKPLFSLENLTLGYHNQPILRHLNLTVHDRDFICIVGPNGSGKTTLIRGILGLIKPISGQIKYHDLNPNSIGYIPQESSIDLHFPASVLEIVLSGTLNRTKFFYSHADRETALHHLDLLGIKNLQSASFADLSGGQRQKVLLARALSATDKLLVLDEPNNNLDPTSKSQLYQLLRELNSKQNIAIIMVTHDLDHDNLLGDKILSLRDKTPFFDTTKEFIRKVHHE